MELNFYSIIHHLLNKGKIMSDTRRWTQPSWNGDTLPEKPKSKKHQQRDRGNGMTQFSKNHRFCSTGQKPTWLTKQRDQTTLNALDFE